MKNRSEIFKKMKRIVLKVGSGLVTDQTGPSLKFIKALAAQIDCLLQEGLEVVLVSSGAVACGMAALGLNKRPKEIPQKQAVAALGQPLLMSHYAQVFEKYHRPVAQILLTRDDLQNRQRFLNAKHSFFELFDFGILPIVNENDSVAVEEIQFGDNDQLSAMVAHVVDAQLLIILTDIDGLYEADPKKNPHAKRIPLVDNVDESTLSFAEGTLSQKSTGGMLTKLKAAAKAALYGVPTWIGQGAQPQIINAVLRGDDVGTVFLPKIDALSSRKYWIGIASKEKGTLVIDEGAVGALIDKKKSLLASGVVKVEGQFDIGDTVSLCSPQRLVIAKGLINYSSSEMQKIKGVKSGEIEKILGYKYYDEVVNRDNLVIV